MRGDQLKYSIMSRFFDLQTDSYDPPHTIILKFFSYDDFFNA